MHVSVRSYLTLGTATVVGAGAIAMTPALPGVAAHTVNLPAPTVAEVSLTASGFSLTDIVGLLGNFDLGGLLPDLGELPPDLVRAVIVEFIKEAGPVVKATAGDIFQYVSSSVNGLVFGPDSIPVRFGSAIAEIPAVVKTAFEDLKDRDFAGALQTLNQGLFAPASAIGQALFEVANGITTYVTTQVSTFVAAVPGLLLAAIQAVIGNNSQGLLDAIQDAVAGLLGGLRPGAAVTPAESKLAAIAEGGVVSDTPAVSEIAPVVDVDAAPAAAAVAPKPAAARAAASARAVAPAAAAESAAEPAIEVESDAEAVAPEADADKVVAPATRSRAAAHRAAVADAVANGPAAKIRAKLAERADRRDAERPQAASASRAG